MGGACEPRAKLALAVAGALGVNPPTGTGNQCDVGSSRGLRGGSWNNNENNLASYNRNNNTPTNENTNVGFRVASVPEPSAVLLTLIAVSASLARRRRSPL